MRVTELVCPRIPVARERALSNKIAARSRCKPHTFAGRAIANAQSSMPKIGLFRVIVSLTFFTYQHITLVVELLP